MTVLLWGSGEVEYISSNSVLYTTNHYDLREHLIYNIVLLNLLRTLIPIHTHLLVIRTRYCLKMRI